VRYPAARLENLGRATPALALALAVTVGRRPALGDQARPTRATHRHGARLPRAPLGHARLALRVRHPAARLENLGRATPALALWTVTITVVALSVTSALAAARTLSALSLVGGLVDVVV
jgi:hypothetical protein